MDIYERLGVRTVVNAAGDFTKFGGTIMEKEVVDAMSEASRSFVKIEELQRVASRVISELTGAAAGHVTSGAAAAVVLASAACMAKSNESLLRLFPHVIPQGKYKTVLQTAHINPYSSMFQLAGGTLSLVEDIEELELALSDGCTASIGFVHERAEFGIGIEEVVELSHKYSVPVIVDAANSLPPLANLRKYIDIGADLVAVSGGKALHGPQASGFVCGRKDLVEFAAQLQLDLGNLDATGVRRSHGLGRPMKVGKEEIVGVIVAIERFMERDFDADYLRWSTSMHRLADRLGHLSELVVRFETRLPNRRPVPCVVLELRSFLGVYRIVNLLESLEASDLRIVVNDSLLDQNALVINPTNLREGEDDLIAERIEEEIEHAVAVGLIRGTI